MKKAKKEPEVNKHWEFFQEKKDDITSKLEVESVCLTDEVYEGNVFRSAFGTTEEVALIRLSKKDAAGREKARFSFYPNGKRGHGLGRTDYAVLFPVTAENVRFTVEGKHSDYFIASDIEEDDEGQITDINGRVMLQRGSVKDIANDMD